MEPPGLFAFQEGLRSFRYVEGMTAKESRKIDRQRREYCRAHLQQSIEKEAEATTREEKQALLATRAHIRLELARYERVFWPAVRVEESLRAEEILFQALSEAEESGDESTVYMVLQQIGFFYLMQEAYDEAARYYQRALAYTRDSWPHGMLDTFHWLGTTWSCREETLPYALLMFDWICLLHPARIDVLMEKYRCLVQRGRLEEVKREAARKTMTTCMEAATTAAARLALGRRKRACAAAQEGLRLAQSQGQQRWLSSFTSLLTTYDR